MKWLVSMGASHGHLLQSDLVNGCAQHISIWKNKVGDCDGIEKANQTDPQSLSRGLTVSKVVVRVNLLE